MKNIFSIFVHTYSKKSCKNRKNLFQSFSFILVIDSFLNWLYSTRSSSVFLFVKYSYYQAVLHTRINNILQLNKRGKAIWEKFVQLKWLKWREENDVPELSGAYTHSKPIPLQNQYIIDGQHETSVFKQIIPVYVLIQFNIIVRANLGRLAISNNIMYTKIVLLKNVFKTIAQTTNENSIKMVFLC